MAASITGSPFISAPGNTVVLTGSGLVPGANASVVLQNQGDGSNAATTLAQPAAQGAQQIIVSDITGIRQGQTITVGNAAPLTVLSTLTSPSAGLLVNLSGGLSAAQAQGAAITAQTQTTLSGSFATFATSSVSFVVPDGARSGTVVVTAGDGSQVNAMFAVNSQYIFGYEYVGEGVDTSVLAPGELDRILQRASAYADAYVGQGARDTMTMRLLQCTEKAKYKESRRIYPRRQPIVTIDQIIYIASNTLKISLDPSFWVTVENLGYTELVIWSFGWTYINQIASVTLVDAGVMQYTYTAGWGYQNYPQVLKDAVSMIATELLSQRSIQASGMGGLSRYRADTAQYDRRNEPFDIPAPAKVLLDAMRIVRPS